MAKKRSPKPRSQPAANDTLRERLTAQVTRLERDCPVWNSELVRDLFDVNELVVGLEVLAEQLLDHDAPHSPAFAVLLDLATERGVGEPTLRQLKGLASRYAVLSLTSGRRGDGRGQRYRDYRELVIDGTAITKRVGRDYIPCFDWLDPAVQLATAEQLAGRREGELPDGRVALCVCPECGDLGCTAVTINVDLTADAAVWQDFGLQNNYEAGFSALDIGPFRFERLAYLRVIDELRAAVRRPPR